jgi:FixJ family two-component response regulator
MTEASSLLRRERVLVLMPTARDAERTVALLAEANVASVACGDLAELCRESRAGAGALLLTDDILIGDSGGQLAEALREQPAWSAIPLLVIAKEGATASVQSSAPDVFNNLIVIERPVRTRSLASVVASALRARHHQYQMRDLLHVREQQSAELLEQGERPRRVATVRSGAGAASRGAAPGGPA